LASTTTRRGRLRATLAAALGAALLVPLAATPVAADTTTDPAEAAGSWLAAQLVDGERFEASFGDDVFPDQGLTADAVFALAAAGVASGTIEAATDWLATQVDAYTGAGGDVWAGATAKLLLVAEVTGRDGTSFGGVDLPAKLLDREQESGRFTDQSGFGDFSNVITQSLAVLALERATAGPSDAAVDYLVDAQCDDGGFPVQFVGACTSSVDGTAFAVQALAAVGGADEAITDAVGWLAATQATDGSFSSPDGVNANSTGLAAVALSLAGRDTEAAAARDWLLATQDGCDDPEPGAIPFNRDDRGDVVRATTQALPGLVSATLGTLSSAGASSALPSFDCDPEPPAERDVAVGCEQDEVRPGDTVDCTITGLLEGDEVRVIVTLTDEPTLLDDTFTADDGQVAFAFDVPDDIEPGATITITVDGGDGEFGATLTLSVTAPDDVDAGGEPVDDTEVLDVVVEADPDGSAAPAAERVAAQEELPETGLPAVLLAVVGLLGLALGSGLLLRTPRTRHTA
jgi:hypothetical protein